MKIPLELHPEPLAPFMNKRKKSCWSRFSSVHLFLQFSSQPIVPKTLFNCFVRTMPNLVEENIRKGGPEKGERLHIERPYGILNDLLLSLVKKNAGHCVRNKGPDFRSSASNNFTLSSASYSWEPFRPATNLEDQIEDVRKGEEKVNP
jgi:hypothetical protein